MTGSQLVEALSNETGLSVSKVEEVVKTIFISISKALASGERVEIRGIGSFSVKHYDGYTGRNPKTGKILPVKPKRLPFFKCGKELKDRVDTYRKSKRRR